MISVRLGLLLALNLVVATPALACDCRTLLPESARFERDLEEITAFYAVGAEGIIEREGDFAWRLRVTREFKGSGARNYRIILSSDCSIEPQAMEGMVGKTVFLLLTPSTVDGATDAYEAGRCVNAQPAAVEDAIRRRMQRVCGSRR